MIFLFGSLIERWLSHGESQIFTDLTCNLLHFHVFVVCGATDHIILAFSVTLNLIQSPNRPVMTKCRGSACFSLGVWL